MSQTATARPLQRSTSRSARPQPLRVVRTQPVQGQPGFVAACLALLVAGLIGVLMLNTAMAKGSFVLGDLQDRSNELADAQEVLTHAIDAQSAAPALAQRALDMGMVPAETAAFLRLSDGKVLGVAAGATAQKEFTVATQGSSAAAASRPAPHATVRTEGAVTTTTVSTAKGDNIEVTTTSVDARTGATSTTTSTRPAPAAPAPAASATPSPSTGAASPTPATAP